MVANRVNVFAGLLDIDADVDVLLNLGRLHFELAGYPLPRQLDALLTLTTVEHQHFESDDPFTPESSRPRLPANDSPTPATRRAP
jgi:hypothetical protein